MFAKKPTRSSANPIEAGHLIESKMDARPKIANTKTNALRQQDRTAFIDITNANKDPSLENKKKVGLLKPKTVGVKSKLPAASKPAHVTNKKPLGPVKGKAVTTKKVQRNPLSSDVSALDQVTSLQTAEASKEVYAVPEENEAEESMLLFDKEKQDDVFHVGIYAKDIFDYYKRRERMFEIPHYMGTTQCHITPEMRAILVDWLAEVQENFELNHETLYLAVKLIDIYLSRVNVDKQLLQLLGAAAVFVASKFDERCPPLIEDFTYVCDNAFEHSELIDMEMELLKKVDFDLGIPISYRFLRRYAKVGRLTMRTLTLARYILELSLMEYDLVKERDSVIAASALYIAMKVEKEGSWEGDVVKCCGYEVEDLKPIIVKLNAMLLKPSESNLENIRSKYSHAVFHEVAKIKPLPTSELL